MTDKPDGNVTTKNPSRIPWKTKRSDLDDLLVVPLVSEKGPNAAGALGVSAFGAYDMARRGDIPTLNIGRRKLVSVPALLKMLGADQ